MQSSVSYRGAAAYSRPVLARPDSTRGVSLAVARTPDVDSNCNDTCFDLVSLGRFAHLYVIVIGGPSFPLLLFPGYEVSKTFRDGRVSAISHGVCGFGIDGRHDGIIVDKVLASFSHQRSMAANQEAEQFTGFVRRCTKIANADPNGARHHIGVGWAIVLIASLFKRGQT